MGLEGFACCEICGQTDWSPVYKGKIRDGAFGQWSGDDAVVAQCGACGVQRLAESHSQGDDIYKTTDYRELLDEDTDAAGFLAEHDRQQHEKLSVLWPHSLRNKVLADVGCGAGSFLDHVSGLASRTLGIEPCVAYHASLRERGHKVYPSTQEAKSREHGSIDMAFSFSVIEHVSDPRQFLADVAELLDGDALAFVSTPNREDVLMEILPDDYPPFFYRSVHRWYFDEASFTECARLAGLAVTRAQCVHRFGLSNAMIWLRDKKPGQRASVAGIEASALDYSWQHYLQQRGSGDYLYFWLKKAS